MPRMEQLSVLNFLGIVSINIKQNGLKKLTIFYFAVCPIPDGVAGTLAIDQNDIWVKGLKAYGETPSDVLGKRVESIEVDFPQFLSLMVDGKGTTLKGTFLKKVY